MTELSLARAVTDFGASLLAAATTDELLSLAPAAVASALGLDETWSCRVALIDPASAEEMQGAPTETAALIVPLRTHDQVVGVLMIEPPAREIDVRPWSDEHLTAVASLLAAAIAARERARVEQERLRVEAAQLKFDIVAMLSHELRTPLSAITGFASALLLDDVDWDDASRTEFLRAIEDESNRMTKLVSDVLDSAVIEAGELRLEIEPILLRHIARRVIDKMALLTKDHHIVLSIPNAFPVVLADQQRIEQVLTNLLDNAIKYSPGGGLIIVGGEVSADGTEVIVSVADEGVGIAPEHLNKLFERFFRARQDDRRPVVGTGLGLPLCDAIVRAHGGRIWAESTLGKGTKLSFTLPTEGRLAAVASEGAADA